MSHLVVQIDYFPDGSLLGAELGARLKPVHGFKEGTTVDTLPGFTLGSEDGSALGTPVGFDVGIREDTTDG